MVSRVVHRLRPRMPAHTLVLGFRDVPPIHIDAVQIEQVLTNLIENADNIPQLARQLQSKFRKRPLPKIRIR